MLVFDIGRDISTMQIFKHEFQHNRYITGTLGLVYILYIQNYYIHIIQSVNVCSLNVLRFFWLW